MTIKIIKEETIYLTQTEHERLRKDWEAVCSYNTDPPTFEEYVKRNKPEIAREIQHERNVQKFFESFNTNPKNSV